jgi:transcriptional regulator with XRE-family HTH domain
MTETLGQLIRERRRQKGITQEAFATLLGEGVRQSEVSRLECGFVGQPRPARLHRIATVLNLPVATLLMLTAWANPEIKSGGPVGNSSVNDTALNGQPMIEDPGCFLDSGDD